MTVTARPCFDPDEAEVWAEAERTDPCLECPAGFAAAARREGRCDGEPGVNGRHRSGAPSLHTEQSYRAAVEMRTRGFRWAEIEASIGIKRHTFYNWLRRRQEGIQPARSLYPLDDYPIDMVGRGGILSTAGPRLTERVEEAS